MQCLLPLHKDLLQKYLTLVDLKSQCQILTLSQRISVDNHMELNRKKVNTNHFKTFGLLEQYNQPSYQIYHNLSYYDLLHFNKINIFYLSLTSKSNFKLCSFFSMYCIYQLRTKGGKKTDINLCNFSFKEDV